MSWQEFLVYALTPAGIGVVVGFVLSWVVEYWPAYETWEPKYKRLVFLVLSFVVPLLGVTLSIATGAGGDWLDFQNTWWPALVAGFTAFTAGQTAHVRKL